MSSRELKTPVPISFLVAAYKRHSRFVDSILSEHCIPVSSADTRRHLRSANRHLLAVPRFTLNTYGRRAFKRRDVCPGPPSSQLLRRQVPEGDCPGGVGGECPDTVCMDNIQTACAASAAGSLHDVDL